MQMYSAHIEVDRRNPRPPEVEDIAERLASFHAAVGTSPRGWLDMQITLPAENAAQAAHLAALVAGDAAKADVIALEVMTEQEFNAREGFVDLPDLIGATEAALILGVSRQRIQQMVHEGKLPAQAIGKSLVIPRATVEAHAAELKEAP